MLDLLFNTQNLHITGHLLAALLAGGAIGLERSHHGRPAGFRTHTLVCLASSVLMMVPLYASQWMPGWTEDVKIDPTRMAQGIMTGIGFLGAGVIYKEAISVRGLTTAASVWITAAIGILMGVGLFFPGILATIFTISILAYFPRIERKLPKQAFVHYSVTFDRGHCPTEPEMIKMADQFGFNVGALTYHALEGNRFEYRMVLRTHDHTSASKFADYLCKNQAVREFNLQPASD
ncbi:MAG TPA: MgtC/SapB family protein [Alphaproteobacteria bacterium]|nr:MgtC/SapB family protein [Alphaproteobacteria bacterium]